MEVTQVIHNDKTLAFFMLMATGKDEITFSLHPQVPLCNSKGTWALIVKLQEKSPKEIWLYSPKEVAGWTNETDAKPYWSWQCQKTPASRNRKQTVRCPWAVPTKWEKDVVGKRRPALRKLLHCFQGCISSKALLWLSLQAHKVYWKAGCCIFTRYVFAGCVFHSVGCYHRCIWEQHSFSAAGCRQAQPAIGQLWADKVLYQQCFSMLWAAPTENKVFFPLHQCSLPISSGKSSFHRKPCCWKLILPEV